MLLSKLFPSSMAFAFASQAQLLLFPMRQDSHVTTCTFARPSQGFIPLQPCISIITGG